MVDLARFSIEKVGSYMEGSKTTINYLRRRLRKQKRKTVLMFFIGLLIGGGIAFNIYYWYPWLQTKFDLPAMKPFKQYGVGQEKEDTQTTHTEDSESTETSETKEQELIKPRIAIEEFTQVSPANQVLNQSLQGTISNYNPSGTILAVKDNEIVLYDNFGNTVGTETNPQDKTYMLASIQKMITGILIGHLIEENELSLTSSLAEYYPDIPNSQNITMDEMLSMTSGLFLDEKLKDSTSKEESINYVVSNVRYEELGKWKYSDVNFFLLAAIIEKITNKSYEENFNELIKEPLNLTHTGFYNEITNQTGLVPSYKYNDQGQLDINPVVIEESNYINELGTGNMYTSTADLLTIIQALVDGKLVSNSIYQQIYQINNANYPYSYKAGTYKKTGYNYAHGVFRGYEPTILMTPDASTAVIYLSNVYTEDKLNVELTKKIFEQISGITPS